MRRPSGGSVMTLRFPPKGRTCSLFPHRTAMAKKRALFSAVYIYILSCPINLPCTTGARIYKLHNLTTRLNSDRCDVTKVSNHRENPSTYSVFDISIFPPPPVSPTQMYRLCILDTLMVRAKNVKTTAVKKEL